MPKNRTNRVSTEEKRQILIKAGWKPNKLKIFGVLEEYWEPPKPVNGYYYKAVLLTAWKTWKKQAMTKSEVLWTEIEQQIQWAKTKQSKPEFQDAKFKVYKKALEAIKAGAENPGYLAHCVLYLEHLPIEELKNE